MESTGFVDGFMERRDSRMTPTCEVGQPLVVDSASDKGKTERKMDLRVSPFWDMLVMGLHACLPPCVQFLS